MNTYNGMSATDLSGAMWRKSSISNSQGACVELAEVGLDELAVRNSRNPEGPALIYTRAEIAALIEGVKMGALASRAQQADVAERVALLAAGNEIVCGASDAFRPLGD